MEFIDSDWRNYKPTKDHKGLFLQADGGDLDINGKPFNYNTLEPKVLKANNLAVLNQIFLTNLATVNEMHRYMKNNKTNCALALFETDVEFTIPDYIADVL